MKIAGDLHYFENEEDYRQFLFRLADDNCHFSSYEDVIKHALEDYPEFYPCVAAVEQHVVDQWVHCYETYTPELFIKLVQDTIRKGDDA